MHNAHILMTHHPSEICAKILFIITFLLMIVISLYSLRTCRMVHDEHNAIKILRQKRDATLIQRKGLLKSLKTQTLLKERAAGIPLQTTSHNHKTETVIAHLVAPHTRQSLILKNGTRLITLTFLRDDDVLRTFPNNASHAQHVKHLFSANIREDDFQSLIEPYLADHEGLPPMRISMQLDPESDYLNYSIIGLTVLTAEAKRTLPIRTYRHNDFLSLQQPEHMV